MATQNARRGHFRSTPDPSQRSRAIRETASCSARATRCPNRGRPTSLKARAGESPPGRGQKSTPPFRNNTAARGRCQADVTRAMRASREPGDRKRLILGVACRVDLRDPRRDRPRGTPLPSEDGRMGGPALGPGPLTMSVARKDPQEPDRLGDALQGRRPRAGSWRAFRGCRCGRRRARRQTDSPRSARGRGRRARIPGSGDIRPSRGARRRALRNRFEKRAGAVRLRPRAAAPISGGVPGTGGGGQPPAAQGKAEAASASTRRSSWPEHVRGQR